MLPKTYATEPDSRYLPVAAHKPAMPGQTLTKKHAHNNHTE